MAGSKGWPWQASLNECQRMKGHPLGEACLSAANIWHSADPSAESDIAMPDLYWLMVVLWAAFWLLM